MIPPSPGSANTPSAPLNGITGENNLSPAPSLAYYAGANPNFVTDTPLAGAPKNAGTYTVKATFAGNSNYNGSSNTKTITIAQANSTVAITWANSTYDGTANTASAQANGITGENNLSPAPSLAYYAGANPNFVTDTPLAGAPKNAGTYTVKATFAGNSNYNGSSNTKTITIAQANSTVAITWANSTYDGTANTASAQANGFAGDNERSPGRSLAYYSGS